MNKNNDRETTLDGSHTKLDDVLMHVTPGIKFSIGSSTYRKYAICMAVRHGGHQYETLWAA